MTLVRTLNRKQLLIALGIAMALLWVVLLVIEQQLEDTGGPGITGL